MHSTRSNPTVSRSTYQTLADEADLPTSNNDDSRQESLLQSPHLSSATDTTIINMDNLAASNSQFHHNSTLQSSQKDTPASQHSPTDFQQSLPPVPFTRFVLLLAVFAGIGGFLFGFDTGVISGALLFIREEFHLNSNEQEWVVSSAIAGAFFGALMGGWSNDRFGRKPSIVLAAVVFTVGGLLMSFSFSLWMLIVARVIIGYGVGLASMTIPVYVAETSPPSHRGYLVSIIVLLITLGQFISYLVDSAFAPMPHGWRLMIGVSVLPAVVQLVCCHWLPESPRYLLQQNRISEAKQVLNKCLTHDTAVTEQQVKVKDLQIEAELEAQKESIASESNMKCSSLFSPLYRRQLLIACSLQMFQQLGGINCAMYFSASLLNKAGFTDNVTAILFSDLVAFANALFSFFSMKTIDHYGRRNLLMFSQVGVIIGLTMLGAVFYQQTSADMLSVTPSKLSGYFAVCALIFYVCCFAIGLGCVPWTVQTELFPSALRARANAAAAATNWFFNFCISLTFLSLSNAIGQAATFWMYAVITLIGLVFVYCCVPETKNRTLEEINEFFIQRAQLKQKQKHMQDRTETRPLQTAL